MDRVIGSPEHFAPWKHFAPQNILHLNTFCSLSEYQIDNNYELKFLVKTDQKRLLIETSCEVYVSNNNPLGHYTQYYPL